MTLILKRCPFCGGKAEIRHVQAVYDWRSGKNLSYFVLCKECLTSGDNYSTAAEAAKHWNRRPQID